MTAKEKVVPIEGKPFYENSECADCNDKLYGKKVFWVPTTGKTPGKKLVCEKCANAAESLPAQQLPMMDYEYAGKEAYAEQRVVRFRADPTGTRFEAHPDGHYVNLDHKSSEPVAPVEADEKAVICRHCDQPIRETHMGNVRNEWEHMNGLSFCGDGRRWAEPIPPVAEPKPTPSGLEDLVALKERVWQAYLRNEGGMRLNLDKFKPQPDSSSISTEPEPMVSAWDLVDAIVKGDEKSRFIAAELQQWRKWAKEQR